MTKQEFADLHRPGNPIVLYNIWDAGSAQAVERAGAKVLATGSNPLASAQGFADGEAIGMDGLLRTVGQIVGAVSVPLSVDFESGYASDLSGLAANAKALIEAGAIGCNLEDQLIGDEGLREPAEQAERIAAVHAAGLFVNARTDTFLMAMKAGEDPNRQELIKQAIDRGREYREAGAGCFFIPGLSNSGMISEIVNALDMPVNVMRLPGMISNAELAALGVARISYGPGSWRTAMEHVEAAARDAFTL
ncbi:MAG: isocitrate lyase/phosphoenolpyruvate mutase family protein [Pseudomonadota bacterium]